MAHDAPKPRPIGFYVALLVALVCVAAIGFIAVRALTVPGGGAEADGVDDEAFISGRTIDVGGGAGGAKGLHIQMMDRDDRTRLAAELESDTIEPLQTQRYRVGRPRATMYLDDGRFVRITADGGIIVMPDRSKAPEAGTLSGNVLVKLFDAGISAAEAAAGSAAPSLTWSGSTLSFDSTLGEASTNAPFVLTSEQFEFRASDAKLLINQTLERLERFTVRKGGTLVYLGGADAPDDGGEAAAAREPGDQEGAARPAQGADARATDAPIAERPREPVVTFYQAALRGDVHLERAGQTIDSDRLDLFARVIDNKLPPGAIASVEVADAPAPGGEAPADPGPSSPPATENGGQPELSDPEAPADPAPGAEPAPAPSPGDNVTLTWTDVLEAVPIREEPPELAENHVLARFTATQSGVVRFADAVAGDASGQAALLEYAMTTRDLVLGGPAQQNVSLKSADVGETRMSRIELSLATGEAYVPGPYTAIGADGISRADCGESARLRFKLVDGRITGELAEVELVGNARATDGESWIEANVLHAYFDDRTDGQSLLRRLQARDDVRLSDGRDADGACQVLDVAFDEDGSTPTSMEASASDGGYFRDDTARVDAQVMRAQFRRHESGSLEAERVWAEGAVTFRRHADNIEITGERLFADADREYLEVEHEGGQARVARGATAIAGEVVRLQGVARTAEVSGRGSFEHRAGAGETASAIQASWSEGMAFDDLAGRLECLGDVAATHEPDPFTRDSIAAYALRVELDPASAAEQGAAPEIQADAPEQQAGDRRILSVYAAGEAFVGFGDALATIESARYGPAPAEGDEPPLEQAFRLSGVEIFADNVAQTLDVPGRGRLFVADLRAAPEGEEDNDRGAALFDWRGSMHADRAAGTGEMLEGVQMTHTRLPDGTKTLLECARLRVAFAPGESEDTAFGGLRSAIADTNVYLRTDTRELTADLLQYDPDEGIARALASDNGRVNVLDRASGTPMSAAAVVWDLNTDRVDIVDPGTITIPR